MHADKWGPAGSIFAALCCLGAAPVLGALSAVGLGFLIHDAFLIPLLALFLGVTMWGVHRDRPRHGRIGPVALSAIGSGLALFGLWISPVIVVAGLAALVGSSLWNFRLVMTARRSRP